MIEKRINARFTPKGAIEAQWKKAVGFIPLDREIIIYKPDSKHSYARIKIGDGVHEVNDLPFVGDLDTLASKEWVTAEGENLLAYIQEILLDAENNIANYIEDSVESLPQADYDQTDVNAKDFIKNKPFYESVVPQITWDGDIANKAVIDLSGEGRIVLVKVQDTPVEASKLQNSIVNIVVDSNQHVLYKEDFEFISSEFGCGLLVDASVPYVLSITDFIGASRSLNLSIPSNGTYFLKVSDQSTELYVEQLSTCDLKKLDAKFLPEEIATEAYVDEAVSAIEFPEIPVNVSAFVNDAGYLTKHQDISGKADVNHTHSEYLTETEINDYVDEAISEIDFPEVPTNVSAFVNDAGYLTKHIDISGKADINHTHSEYLTDTDLSNKNYLTSDTAQEITGEKRFLSSITLNKCDPINSGFSYGAGVNILGAASLWAKLHMKDNTKAAITINTPGRSVSTIDYLFSGDNEACDLGANQIVASQPWVTKQLSPVTSRMSAAEKVLNDHAGGIENAYNGIADLKRLMPKYIQDGQATGSITVNNGKAYGKGSAAFGAAVTNAEGTNSFAVGSGVAGAHLTIAGGEWAKANGFASTALGGQTTTANPYQLACGYNNSCNAGTLFEVGNGFALDAEIMEPVSLKPTYEEAIANGRYFYKYLISDEGVNEYIYKPIVENAVEKTYYDQLSTDSIYLFNIPPSNAFEVLKDGRAKAYGAPEAAEDVVRLRELNRLQAELEGRVTTATFNITEDTTIELENLDGMTEIDWGDGTINSELTHEYKYKESETGVCEYICKIYDVTSIGSNAFENCSSLTSVVIGDSVTTIGWAAFDDCGGLTSVIIPDSVTTIGVDAFSNCVGITKIELGKNLNRIEEYAFGNCTSLKSIKIPESVTTIQIQAFYGCTNLSTLYFNAVNASVGSGAFSKVGQNSADGLKVIFGSNVQKVPDDMFSHGSDYGLGKNSESSPKVTKVVFTQPSSCQAIGEKAFFYLTDIKELDLPDSVLTIGSDAFACCTGLSSIKLPENLQTIGNSVLHWTGIKELAIPNSVQSIGTNILSTNFGIQKLTVPFIGPSVAASLANSFEYFFGTKKSDVPSSLKAITINGGGVANYSLTDCPFTDITFGPGVYSIGNMIVLGYGGTIRFVGATPPTFNGTITSGMYPYKLIVPSEYKEAYRNALSNFDKEQLDAIAYLSDITTLESADTYATKSEVSDLQTALTTGTITVKNATNATNATSAINATKDSDGNTISSTYGKRTGNNSWSGSNSFKNATIEQLKVLKNSSVTNTYSAGIAGQVVMSNGSSAYWGDLPVKVWSGSIFDYQEEYSRGPTWRNAMANLIFDNSAFADSIYPAITLAWNEHSGNFEGSFTDLFTGEAIVARIGVVDAYIRSTCIGRYVTDSSDTLLKITSEEETDLTQNEDCYLVIYYVE